MALADSSSSVGGGLSYKTVAVTLGISDAVTQGLAQALGGDADTLSIEELLHVRCQDFEDAVNTLAVDGQPATALQKGAASKLIRRIAEVGGMPPPALGGLGQQRDARPAVEASSEAGGRADRKRKLSAILDQADDGEVELLADNKLRTLYANYEAVNGGPPREHEDVTPEQLSALAARLAADEVPFTDFALWGPFGRRQAKLLRFTAQVFVGGELVTKQVSGPPSFEAWRDCWRVFRTAMVMLKGASMGALDQYEEGVRRLSVAFPGQWGFIAKADEIMRAEQWERIRRHIESQLARDQYREPWDPARPWESVIRDSAPGSEGVRATWWYENVNQPCLLASQGRGRAASDGVPERERGSKFQAPVDYGHGAGSGASAKKKSTRKSKSAGLSQIERRKDGRHVRAADGTQLCFAWNRAQHGCQTPCAAKPPRAHQCEWCLGAHRAVDDVCRSEDRPQGWRPPPPPRS